MRRSGVRFPSAPPRAKRLPQKHKCFFGTLDPKPRKIRSPHPRHSDGCDMANIRFRQGRWQVQVRKQGYPQATRSFLKRAEAFRWASQTESQADRAGLPVDHRALFRVSVRTLIERYRRDITPKKRSADRENYVLDTLARSPLGQLDLAAATADQVAAYRDARLKVVTPSSVLRELAVIQHVFEVARRDWGVPLAANPASLVRKPSPNRHRQRRITADEWSALKAVTCPQ